MMPTKELQEVYNNAQEVTSLGSTDRLLAKDADGNPKSISSENLKDKIQFTSTAGKWHTLLALGLGGRASVGSMAITTSPVNQECFLLKWSIMRTGSITPKVFEIFNPLTSFGVTIMPKLRVLAPTSSGFPAYIEVFITEPKTVDVCLGACVNVHFNYGINTGIPSGYNVLEFDLSIFGGGVIYSFPINYAILQKGGLRDDAYERIDQRYREGYNGGCDGRQREMRGCRYFGKTRSVYFRYQYQKFAKLEFSVWYCGSIHSLRKHLSKNHCLSRFNDGCEDWTPRGLDTLEFLQVNNFHLTTERRAAA